MFENLYKIFTKLSEFLVFRNIQRIYHTLKISKQSLQDLSDLQSRPHQRAFLKCLRWPVFGPWFFFLEGWSHRCIFFETTVVHFFVSRLQSLQSGRRNFFGYQKYPKPPWSALFASFSLHYSEPPCSLFSPGPKECKTYTYGGLNLLVKKYNFSSLTGVDHCNWGCIFLQNFLFRNFAKLIFLRSGHWILELHSMPLLCNFCAYTTNSVSVSLLAELGTYSTLSWSGREKVTILYL